MEFHHFLFKGPRIDVLVATFCKAVGVSSMTGDGVKEFFDAVESSREEYEKWVDGFIAFSFSFLIIFRTAIDHVNAPGTTFQNCNAPGLPAINPFKT